MSSPELPAPTTSRTFFFPAYSMADFSSARASGAGSLTNPLQLTTRAPLSAA
jgi:hypothetical protein